MFLYLFDQRERRRVEIGRERERGEELPPTSRLHKHLRAHVHICLAFGNVHVYVHILKYGHVVVNTYKIIN